MIDLGTPAAQIDGLTFLAGVETGAWYVLPERPQLRRTPDGEPDFSFVKFRDSVTGEAGGILRLSVDLSVPNEKLEQATAQLRSRGGAPVSIAALPVRHVRSELFVWAEDPQLGGLAHGDATTDAPFTSSFTVRLSTQGATLYEAALAHGTAPGGVMYWLACAAQRPAIGARVEIDTRRVGEYVMEHFGPEPLAYAQITDVIPVLQQDGLIRMEVLAADDSASTMRRAQESLARIVLTDVFTAYTPDVRDPAASLPPEALALQTRRYRLKDGAPRRLMIDLSAPEAVTSTVACGGAMGQLLEPFRRDSIIAVVSESEQLPV